MGLILGALSVAMAWLIWQIKRRIQRDSQWFDLWKQSSHGKAFVRDLQLQRENEKQNTF